MTTLERESLIETVTSRIYGPYDADVDEEFFNELKTTLNSYSDAMLSRLANKDAGSNELDRVEYLIADGENETVVNEALHFLGLIPTQQDSFVINAVRGLHSTQSLPQYEDYSTADESTYKQCIALISVTIAIMGSHHVGNVSSVTQPKATGVRFATVLSDENLTRLVMDRHEDYTRIINIIHDRKTANAGVISDVLNAPTPSLSNGSL